MDVEFEILRWQYLDSNKLQILVKEDFLGTSSTWYKVRKLIGFGENKGEVWEWKQMSSGGFPSVSVSPEICTKLDSLVVGHSELSFLAEKFGSV